MIQDLKGLGDRAVRGDLSEYCGVWPTHGVMGLLNTGTEENGCPVYCRLPIMCVNIIG